jgi:hypothetical protein
MDEADDDWDQDDRFGEDGQESFEINLPSNTNHASDHGKSLPVHVHPLIRYVCV